ncbi:OmpA family protein [Hyphomicrobium sp. xq]|uniref:OmpA family protein n=1 Tax=Hyphomicrobium album TaxID=2665159 RepID=A0A6I3KLH0_9HYPH|nr:OmpA family protein [Hyphomicrobium album]MTD93571.1 OmpA family protein [Hyphomicrobium album]
MFKTRFTLLGGVAFLLLSVLVGQAADAPTVDDLIDKLQVKPRKPGAGVATNKERPPSVKGGRKLTTKERKDVAETVRRDDLPTADLEVYFDFNSAVIAPSALSALKTLGQALADKRLAGGTFIVGGHTDAKGEADYNQRLSQRRAQAVRDFLVTNFPIDPAKLMAVGYGEEQLKAADEPLAAVNRRVQVINWTDVAGR